VFERSCGATTPFSTHVSVLDRAEALPHTAGNIFDADGNHRTINEVKVTVQWLSPKELVLRYPARAKVFSKMTEVHGVAIVYQATP
jgi:hypothetical protein